MIIDNVSVKAVGFNPDRDELNNYVRYVNQRVQNVKNITVTLANNNEVDIAYTTHNEKFERIRRVTGYLVGSLERWNDAKQAEEHDRVKHS